MKRLTLLAVLVLALAGCGGSSEGVGGDQALMRRLNRACYRGGAPINFDFRHGSIVVSCYRDDALDYQVITDRDGRR